VAEKVVYKRRDKKAGGIGSAPIYVEGQLLTPVPTTLVARTAEKRFL
jgi:hypothetical protein